MKVYLRLLKYLKPYYKRFILAVFCTAMAAAGNLYIPWIVKDMVDKVLTTRDYAMLNLICLSIVIIFIVRGFFYFGQSYLMAYVGQKVIIDIRADLYKKLNKLTLAFFEKNKTGTIMSYITNDVAALQIVLTQSAIEMFTEGLILCGSILAMFLLDWRLTLFTFATFPIVLVVIDFFGKKIRASGHKIQERTADLTSVLQESVLSAKVIKSFVREDYEIKRFEQENLLNFQANMKNSQLAAILTPTVEFTAAVGVTIILWYGGRSVISGEITSGALIAFLVYAVNIANPVKRLTKVFSEVQKALAAAERVFHVLDIIPDITDKKDALALPCIKGDVRFDNVSFGYNDGKNIIKNLSFNVKSGQLIAIVGPSGAGKSTISNLLCRFYDVTCGNISIDGINIKDVTTASLREQIGIVPQETVLFNKSIYDNILYGNLDADEAKVKQAAIFANADGFISQMVDGYNTLLGDRGVNLSGGQRQRISIARAILKDPRILILDEATSALDTESEKVVQEALDRLLVGRTSFVIAHRLSTIQRADLILVLDKGQLVGSGTHDELLAKGGLYKNLYQSQFRDDKLESGEA